jgi:hypothetical protein
MVTACHEHGIEVKRNATGTALEFRTDGELVKNRGIHSHIREKEYDADTFEYAGTPQGNFVNIVEPEQRRGARFIHHAYQEPISQGVSNVQAKSVIHARMELLPTECRQSLIHPGHNKMCLICKKPDAVDTVTHTICGCEARKGDYIKRHDAVQKICLRSIQACARGDNEVAIREAPSSGDRSIVRLPFVNHGDLEGLEHYQPDMVVYREIPREDSTEERRFKIEVIEFAVANDQSMKDRYDEKVSRYGRYVARLQSHGHKVSFTPVVIGARGYVCQSSLDALAKFFERFFSLTPGAAKAKATRLITKMALDATTWISKFIDQTIAARRFNNRH